MVTEVNMHLLSDSTSESMCTFETLLLLHSPCAVLRSLVPSEHAESLVLGQLRLQIAVDEHAVEVVEVLRLVPGAAELAPWYTQQHGRGERGEWLEVARRKGMDAARTSTRLCVL